MICLTGDESISWPYMAAWAGVRAYCKEVDALETTIRFWQEIYDERGVLVEIHEKYPVDTGHRKV
jgi:hypothetical protein